METGHGIGRILDANLNRAREGLRVMEEYARFVREDAAITAAIKAVRHDLTAAFGMERIRTLVGSRDIQGDIGTQIRQPAEAVRGEVRDVVWAACKRTTEALRSLEEYAKVVDAELARRVEQLRYRTYDVERRLVLHEPSCRAMADVRVYVLVTESLCAGDWLKTAQAVLAGGAGALQLREKQLADRVVLQRARQLAGLCRERGARFIVNDRPDIALAAGADGVHVGREDLPPAQARRVLGAEAIIGVSTHNVEQFQASVDEGAADYVAVGPMFPTDTRPQEGVAGPRTLRAVRGRTSLPVAAIGGITPDNAGAVLEADPRAILCVCRSVIAAADPQEVVRQLLSQADRARSMV